MWEQSTDCDALPTYSAGLDAAMQDAPVETSGLNVGRKVGHSDQIMTQGCFEAIPHQRWQDHKNNRDNIDKAIVFRTATIPGNW